jgi:iron complex transport system substrate-binding protein
LKNDIRFIRIVSLAPSITETLFSLGLGDRIVGKTEQCDWPSECSKIPTVGSFSTVAADDILSLNPDLVLGTTLHQRFIEEMRCNNISAEMIPPKPVYEAPEVIRLIGTFTGVIHEGNVLANKVTDEINTVKNSTAHFQSISVCYLCNITCPVWYSCPIAACVEFLNCRLAGRKRSGQLDIVDSIIADKPQRIIIPQCGRCKETCIDPLLKGTSALQTYIKTNDVPVVTLRSKLLARPGPRAAQALHELGKTIFGSF